MKSRPKVCLFFELLVLLPQRRDGALQRLQNAAAGFRLLLDGLLRTQRPLEATPEGIGLRRLFLVVRLGDESTLRLVEFGGEARINRGAALLDESRGRENRAELNTGELDRCK